MIESLRARWTRLVHEVWWRLSRWPENQRQLGREALLRDASRKTN